MRFTITKKIMLGVGSVVLIGVLAVIGVYRALMTVEDALYHVTDIAEPISAAAYEMEINVIGTGLGVMKYLETGAPHYRARVEKDEADFARFKSQFDRLATTPQVKAFGNRIGLLYQQFKALGDTLMHTRDQQEGLFAMAAKHFATMDDIIDDDLQAHIDRQGPQGVDKLIESARIEADIVEVGAWLGHYLRTSQPAYKGRMFDDANEVREKRRGSPPSP